MKKKIFFLILAITNYVFSSESHKKTELITNGCIAQVLPISSSAISNSSESFFTIQPIAFLLNPHIYPKQGSNQSKKRSFLESPHKK